ncbi:pyridoxal phosphate-dependent decarboxylase family protein [Chitinophaga rhizosphaerae]|uniref:pyridoxal phosphate-dependent decarboxylase family protein n=1 Tax=Chitinophaga rhizosphaerae TaxID=1864947 RepID=UPI000F8115DB|nr:pyridoxal-dependent decarboxylase [Chitinophaga rhizosphaerae]
MNAIFREDLSRFDELLQQTANYAGDFLGRINELPVSMEMPAIPVPGLPEKGIGGQGALELFDNRFGAYLTASAGPRYFGFVTGGVSPAALSGDWLASAVDMNAADKSSLAFTLEKETLQLLRQLFSLPEAYEGVFVTGATMSNFTGLAAARQWLGEQYGVNVAAQGVGALPEIKVLAATPHSSVVKALSMLGLGRNSLVTLSTLPGREAVDVRALEQWIAYNPDTPFIYVASAGTVNTVDFDDIAAIAALKHKHPFWLHVDAAFGGFAAVSPRFRHFLNGWEQADSITIDAHKWLNVPYDCAMLFSRHPMLQLEVFQNAGAAYLGDPAQNFNYINYAPENSRRLRALPAWFSLRAYGAEGYRDIVEQNVKQAHHFGEMLEKGGHFRLLAPVKMCVACFTFNKEDRKLAEHIRVFLQALNKRGVVYVTPTQYAGLPAMRAALVNWRTTDKDIELAVQEMETVAAAIQGVSAILENN